jgi:hypothetical protein
MEQRRGMDELDCCGELVVASAGISEQGPAGERQHRPHPLAAARDQVTGKLGDERDLALHAVEDDGVDAVHVASDKRHQRIERRRPRALQIVDGSGHGAALAGQRRFS